MRIEIVVNERIVRSGDQREDLHIQKENTGKENRMLNWVRAGYGWETSVTFSLLVSRVGSRISS
jgi:hypothetical protein